MTTVDLGGEVTAFMMMKMHADGTQTFKIWTLTPLMEERLVRAFDNIGKPLADGMVSAENLERLGTLAMQGIVLLDSE